MKRRNNSCQSRVCCCQGSHVNYELEAYINSSNYLGHINIQNPGSLILVIAWATQEFKDNFNLYCKVQCSTDSVRKYKYNIQVQYIYAITYDAGVTWKVLATPAKFDSFNIGLMNNCVGLSQYQWINYANPLPSQKIDRN